MGAATSYWCYLSPEARERFAGARASQALCESTNMQVASERNRKS
jgi:hypothetical protein